MSASGLSDSGVMTSGRTRLADDSELVDGVTGPRFSKSGTPRDEGRDVRRALLCIIVVALLLGVGGVMLARTLPAVPDTDGVLVMQTP